MYSYRLKAVSNMGIDTNPKSAWKDVYTCLPLLTLQAICSKSELQLICVLSSNILYLFDLFHKAFDMFINFTFLNSVFSDI